MPFFYVSGVGATVQTAELDDGSVTAVKLATDAVETAKIKDVNVTTAKVANDAVGFAKLNADIVGIDTTTGKINAINATNFSNLDGSNLTGVGGVYELTATAETTQTASFSTSSATWVDVTNPATATLSGLTAGNTYTVIAFSTGSYANATGELRMSIGGTDQSSIHYISINSTQIAITGIKTGITGVTSVDCKLRAQSSATLTIAYNASAPGQINHIFAMAFRTA